MHHGITHDANDDRIVSIKCIRNHVEHEHTKVRTNNWNREMERESNLVFPNLGKPQIRSKVMKIPLLGNISTYFI